jgi:hypothetical protein
MKINKSIVNLLISIMEVLIIIQLLTYLINKVISNNQVNIINQSKNNIIKNMTVIKL